MLLLWYLYPYTRMYCTRTFWHLIWRWQGQCIKICNPPPPFFCETIAYLLGPWLACQKCQKRIWFRGDILRTKLSLHNYRFQIWILLFYSSTYVQQCSPMYFYWLTVPLKTTRGPNKNLIWLCEIWLHGVIDTAGFAWLLFI